MRYECFPTAAPHASGELGCQMHLHWLLRGSNTDIVIPLCFNGVFCWIFFFLTVISQVGIWELVFPTSHPPFSSPRCATRCFCLWSKRGAWNTTTWLVASSTISHTVWKPFPWRSSHGRLWLSCAADSRSRMLPGDSTSPSASIHNQLSPSLAGSDLREMFEPRTVAIPCWPVPGEGQGTRVPSPQCQTQGGYFSSGGCSKFCVPRHGQACVSTGLKFLFLSKSLEIIHVCTR